MNQNPSSAYPTLAQQANPLGLADFTRHEKAWHRAKAVLRNIDGMQEEGRWWPHPCATPKQLEYLKQAIAGLFLEQTRDGETITPRVTTRELVVWELHLPAGYDLRNFDAAYQLKGKHPLPDRVGEVAWPAQAIEPAMRHCLTSNLLPEYAAFLNAVQVSARYVRADDDLDTGYDLHITLDASMPFARCLASYTKQNPRDLHALDFDTLYSAALVQWFRKLCNQAGHEEGHCDYQRDMARQARIKIWHYCLRQAARQAEALHAYRELLILQLADDAAKGKVEQ